ncbi:MAG: hypothetical protein V1728_01215 [Candidatus Micrarchaeota archaeon]
MSPSRFASRLALLCAAVLFLFASFASASVVEMGLWQFDSNLSEPQALGLLSGISFKPAPNFSKDAWDLTSSGLQFSDSVGDISSEVVLTPTCPDASNCTSSSDIYTISNGKVLRMGKLSFKPNNIFNIDHSSLDTKGAADNSLLPSGSSEPASPPPQTMPDLIFAFLQQWLGLITLGVVVGLTVFHIWHSRY